MTTSERLTRIANKGAELIAIEQTKQLKKAETIAKYEQDIKALASRISQLIDIAVALRQNDIPLGAKEKDIIGYKESLKTDGWAHKLGFFYEYRNGEEHFYGIGIRGGGCCGGDLAVDADGYMIKRINPYYSSYQYDGYYDYCNKCKQFLNDFDAFEKRVYEYVDNL